MSETIWTHRIQILAIDQLFNKVSLRISEGEGTGQEVVASFPMLSSMEGLEGKIVLADFDLEGRWINRLHPGRTAVDGVSLSLMKMLVAPFERLKEAWLETTTMVSKQSFICEQPEPQSLIDYNARRYHWQGRNKGLSFRENEVSFEGEPPVSVLTAVRLRPLREVVDHPGIPKNAIATTAWCRDGITHISYDVEDVDMEDVFGPIARHGLGQTKKMTEGKIR